MIKNGRSSVSDDMQSQNPVTQVDSAPFKSLYTLKIHDSYMEKVSFRCTKGRCENEENHLRRNVTVPDRSV